MNCYLTLARRNGVPLSKSYRSKPDLGKLEVVPSEPDRVLGRSVTMARFMGTRRHELINAELVQVSGNVMILSGLERRHSEGGGLSDFAQTWLVEFLTH